MTRIAPGFLFAIDPGEADPANEENPGGVQQFGPSVSPAVPAVLNDGEPQSFMKVGGDSVAATVVTNIANATVSAYDSPAAAPADGDGSFGPHVILSADTPGSPAGVRINALVEFRHRPALALRFGYGGGDCFMGFTSLTPAAVTASLAPGGDTFGVFFSPNSPFVIGYVSNAGGPDFQFITNKLPTIDIHNVRIAAGKGGVFLLDLDGSTFQFAPPAAALPMDSTVLRTFMQTNPTVAGLITIDFYKAVVVAL